MESKGSVVEQVIQHYIDNVGDLVRYDPNVTPDITFNKFIDCDNTGFTYLGRVNRITYYKESVQIMTNVAASFVRNNETEAAQFDLEYRQCQPTVETGYLAVSKYGKKKPDGVNGLALTFAYRFLHFMFDEFVTNSSVITWDDCMKSINKNTSCGYPYSSHNYFKSKKQFFELKHWQFVVESLENKAFSDDSFRVFWQVSQKYEMRSNAKLDMPIQKIRVFLAAPVDFVVLQNKYCLDFNNKFMMAFNSTFSKVGMSKFKRGWHNLITSFGDYECVLGIDGKEFDTTISSVITDIVRDYRCDSYDPDLDRRLLMAVLKFIYLNIQNSLLVLEKGYLLLKEVGNTSGQANTIIDNTMASIIALCYMYYQRCMEIGIDPSCEHLVKLMRCAIVGDDCCVGVRLSDVNFLNFTVMDKYYTQLGMCITRESAEHIPLFECEFLSTKFIKSENGIYLPLMNRNKMFCSLIIGDKNPDPMWILLRIFAFRIECWADKAFIKMLLHYENHIYQTCRKYLGGDLYVGKFQEIVSWEQIKTMRLNDYELDYLYYGYESSNNLRCIEYYNEVVVKLSAILNLEN